MLAIGESVVLDDLVAANIIARLEVEIPEEFWKAEKKLRRDDKKHRATILRGERSRHALKNET
jgi:hypothetical protein